VELSPNGAFNVTEFGTVTDANQFKALYAYSPYHRVKDGTQYPAILLTTGDNNARVDPMQSRKMAARLQASGTRQPVLLRTSSTAGHGIGSSIDERVALWTDIDGFLLKELAAGAGAAAHYASQSFYALSIPTLLSAYDPWSHWLGGRSFQP